MSWEMLNLCAQREFRTAVRKQVIMYLADKASSEGEGVWCSKYRIARETELSLASVKRAMKEFVLEGILIETGTRGCDRGYTVVYNLSIAAVTGLPSLKKEPEGTTRITENRVHADPPTRFSLHPVPGSERTPNHSTTTPEPSLLEQVLSEIWTSYPTDRVRRFEQCKEILAKCLGDGFSPAEIIAGAKAYATATKAHERNRVFFLDNWLRNRQWRDYSKNMSSNKPLEELEAGRVAAQRVQWIIARSGLCRHISAEQATELVERGFVSEKQARTAGVLR